MRAYWEIAVSGYRRYATYRGATLAGAFTNCVFGLMRGYVLLTGTAVPKASAQQKQDLAAFIHLCGGGPATAFARRKFQMNADERCGDHLVSAYVGKVNAMKRQCQRLAADDGS